MSGSSYTPQTWIDGPSGNTPQSAARWNHIEQGIATVDSVAHTALDSASTKLDAATADGKYAAPAGPWQANTAYPKNSIVTNGGQVWRAPAAVVARSAFQASDWEMWASSGGGNISVIPSGGSVTGLADGTMVFELVPVGAGGTYVFPKGDKGDPGTPGTGGGSSFDLAAGASTATIQAALNAAEGTVRLGPGTFNITAPLVLPRRCSLVGQGGATHLVAASGMTAVILVGNGGPCDRWAIRNLVIDCNGNATTGIDVNVIGTTGNDKGEPDSQGFIEDLYINDPTYGIWYRGSDTQAVRTVGVRVRRAAQYGFYIQAPDNWWRECEATTTGASGAGGVGISAGFYAGGANCHFDHCKAWYCRGVGWNIVCTRSVFVGCEAQDNSSHGWWLQYDKNAFVGCWSDMAGRQDIGGLPNTADGFYMENGFTATTIAGCFSIDRAQGVPAQQRWGFNVPASWYNLTPAPMAGVSGYGNTAGLLNLR